MGRALGRVAWGIGSILLVLGVFVPTAGAVSSDATPPPVADVSAPTNRATLRFDAASDQVAAPIAKPPTASDPVQPSAPTVVAAAPVSAAITGTVTTTPVATLNGYCAEATDVSTGGFIGSATIASDGTYALVGLLIHVTGVAPVSQDFAVRFVDCTGGGDYLPRWYGGGVVTPNSDPSRDGAVPVTVSSGKITSGIDGVLSLGAHLTGTVTDTDGHPLEQVCVAALADRDPQAMANTAVDGTYDLLAPPGTFVVGFYDCSGSDVVTQFWDHVSREADATQVTVVVGSTTPGLDAALVHGGHVVGVVTDATTHDPIENVCVSAWNDDANGSSRTDNTGQYDVGSLPPGSYETSFVDCADHPTHGGTSRSGVVVISGKKVTLDIELGEAAAGTISGHLTTVFGTPLEGACVAVLSGFSGQPHFTGPTGPDGAFEVDEIGSGNYFVGFFGCNSDNATAPMLDPAHPGTTYHAQWYSNEWLGRDPDPFADGATPVEVASGKTTIVNECFDACNDSIWITGAVAGDQTVTLAFLSTVPGAPVSAGLSAEAVAADQAPAETPTSYVATCTSSDGGVIGTASSGASPVVVSGLTNGTTYSCVLAATVGDTTYESLPSAALVPRGADPTPTAPVLSNVVPTNAALAFTGAAHTTQMVIAGLAMVLVGAVALLLARRRRPSVRT